MNIKDEDQHVDTTLGEKSVIRVKLFDHNHHGRKYDLLEIESICDGEKPAEMRLLKIEAEFLRNFLNKILPEMKGTE
ncbi:hypothetical protein FDI95_gp105 [Citrobacter phage CF1 ERZ-2017]|uniref:Uncharacterized protein n=1 Tax=Citrobacter phage CF1 ERZ-2017 TaxID=2267236 RepID=A0A2H4YFM9_9CAUD|nr:hypothetical protein FDI95_gp105 [Citrobacter phage CF1 ERZ-2017]AUE22978.1 hypothetical protein Cf1_00105 [Citrobacter phage CF1 ERZ-2017]